MEFTWNIDNIFAPLTAMVDEACKEQTKAPEGWTEIEIEITSADCNAGQLTSSPYAKADCFRMTQFGQYIRLIVCV